MQLNGGIRRRVSRNTIRRLPGPRFARQPRAVCRFETAWLTADSLFWALFVVQEPALQSSGLVRRTVLVLSTRAPVGGRPRRPIAGILRIRRWCCPSQRRGGSGAARLVRCSRRVRWASYDRAIALDSAFTPSYPHAAFIALGRRRSPGPCATSRHTFVGVHRHRSAACCGSWRHCSPRDWGRTSVRRGCSTPCRCTRSAKPSDCSGCRPIPGKRWFACFGAMVERNRKPRRSGNSPSATLLGANRRPA